MVRWHHQLNGHEFEHTPGDDEGQGSLVCCRGSMGREAWLAPVHEVARVRQDLTTKLPLMVPVTLKLS